jgi:8-amino-7-oxononanoate synthase
MDKKHLMLLEKRKIDGNFRQLTLQGGGIDFLSNDYLGLSKDAILTTSSSSYQGSTGSRLLSGNSANAEICERFLASHFNVDSALVFSSGYNANIGFFSCIPLRGDIILYDECIHVSMKDGFRLSFANAFSFKHNDLEDLEKKINRLKGKLDQNASIYVAVESLYSMTGDISPLKNLVSLSQSLSYKLIVDEAHSVGVFGKNGTGLVAELGLSDSIFARIITFGKAFGFHGAAVLGSKKLREYLINFSRPFIYTTALPPKDFDKIVSMIGTDDLSSRQKLLQEKIDWFNAKIPSGLLTSDVRSPIKMVQIDSLDAIQLLVSQLLAANITIKPILYPTVPIKQQGLRICLHSFNTLEEISVLCSVLSSLKLQ